MPPQPLHDCPGRCGRKVAYNRLACPPCWLKLPQPLKDEVNEAHRRRTRDPGRHLRAVSAAMDWYRDV